MTNWPLAKQAYQLGQGLHVQARRKRQFLCPQVRSGQFRPMGQRLIWSPLTVRVTRHKSYNLKTAKFNRIN